jgi:GT2 family glycosyltransferase
MEGVGVQNDELFFGIDDVEYSYRACKGGWKNIVVRDALIFHSASKSVVPRSGLQVYYLFRNVLYFRYREFSWFQNLPFAIVFVARYVLAAGLYRCIQGRHNVNAGVALAIRDFFVGKMGECTHPILVNRSR